jgi:hypothetical protein
VSVLSIPIYVILRVYSLCICSVVRLTKLVALRDSTNKTCVLLLELQHLELGLIYLYRGLCEYHLLDGNRSVYCNHYPLPSGSKMLALP